MGQNSNKKLNLLFDYREREREREEKIKILIYFDFKIRIKKIILHKITHLQPIYVFIFFFILIVHSIW